MQKTLGQSYLFQEIVRNDKCMNAIKNLNISNAIELDKLSDVLSTIDMRVRSILKDDVLTMLKNGKIILLNTDRSDRLPRYLTTVSKKSSNTSKYHDYYVELSYNIRNVNKTTGNIDIPVVDLYALLESAYINFCLQNAWNKVANNMNIMIWGSRAYSRLMGKILDKQYAVYYESSKRDVVHFMLAKFFIMNMCGYEDITENVIDSITIRQSVQLKVPDIKAILGNTETPSTYDNIFNLFECMKKIHGLEKLNIRSFVENYVRMYGESSLMSIDYLPSFLYMMHSTTQNSSIYRSYIINTVVEREASKLVIEFGKLVRNL